MDSESDFKQELEKYKAEIEKGKRAVATIRLTKNHWIGEHKRIVLYLFKLAIATGFKGDLEMNDNKNDIHYNGFSEIVLGKLYQHLESVVKSVSNVHEEKSSETGSSIVEVTVLRFYQAKGAFIKLCISKKHSRHRQLV